MRDSGALSMSKDIFDYSFQHESSLDDKMELIVLELIITDWFIIMTDILSKLHLSNIYQMSNKDILDD